MTAIDVIKAALAQVATTVGTPVNWATQFTNALNAPTAAGIASETLVGLTQLATDPEVIAGLSTKAMSAKQSPSRTFASVSAMSAAAATTREGSIASLPAFTTTNGGVAASLWMLIGTTWTPVLGLRVTNLATLGDLKTYPATYTGITFTAYTRAFMAVAPGVDEYIWKDATLGFKLWNSPELQITSFTIQAATNLLVPPWCHRRVDQGLRKVSVLLRSTASTDWAGAAISIGEAMDSNHALTGKGWLYTNGNRYFGLYVRSNNWSTGSVQPMTTHQDSGYVAGGNPLAVTGSDEVHYEYTYKAVSSAA